MIHLTEVERDVLNVFKACHGGSGGRDAMAAYCAAPGFSAAEAIAVCRDLRRRKLLCGEGRGTHAYYWISDKGLAALSA